MDVVKKNAGETPESPGRLSDLSSFLRAWFIAVRPFSFSASAIAVMFGTALAVRFDSVPLNLPLALLSVLGMVLLHGAANVLNDVADFKRGIDREIFPASGAVVRKLLTPKEANTGAYILFAIGSLVGFFIALRVGWLIVLIGAVGLAVGVLYSVTPVGLKYRALGDPAVFLNFGILGSLGAWTVQTGRLSWLPVLWSVPFSLLVIAILHANNWRDISSDRSGNFTTVAAMLGSRGSLWYYAVLIFAPYLLVLLYMLVKIDGLPAMPFSFLITFLSLPLARRLLAFAKSGYTSRSAEFLSLDGLTAQLNLIFGVLCLAACMIAAR